MRATHQRDVVDAVPATVPDGGPMVELEPAPFLASPAVRVDVSTSAVVALPDEPPDPDR